jgi:hypothetical protein
MIRILDAAVSFRSQRLATRLVLSSGPIEELTEATASVVVEAAGQRATGYGAVYLSDLWAWPDDSLSHDVRDDALRRICETIANVLPAYFRWDALHPLELGLRLHDLACHEIPCDPSPPALARAMCASPFDAAIHDAAGLASGRSAFSFYDDPLPFPTADKYFPDGGACRAIAKIIGHPRRELPAWYVVGKCDDFDATLIPAIRHRGYRCFKLKLSGDDNDADAGHTIDVFRAATAVGAERIRLTADTNEANPSAESVLDYLLGLQSADRDAYDALEYLEQPTNRDIRQHAFDWRPVTALKPVLLDEGLTGFDVLAEAQRQGYSGLALKTCKGHSMLLACAAWARRHGMVISLQDLTNPGISLIHGALVGAHLPTINGAELNSPQFTPEANRERAARMPELFEPRGGVHRLPLEIPPGLGSCL